MRRSGGVARSAARWATGLVTPLVACLPAVARACPVCFGNDAGPLTQGARAAAFVLLGLTALVLGGLAAFVLRLYRRQRAAAGAAGPAAGTATANRAADVAAGAAGAERPTALAAEPRAASSGGRP